MAKDAESLADLAFLDIVHVDMEKVNLVADVGLEPIDEGLIILSDVSPVGVAVDDFQTLAFAQVSQALVRIQAGTGGIARAPYTAEEERHQQQKQNHTEHGPETIFSHEHQ